MKDRNRNQSDTLRGDTIARRFCTHGWGDAGFPWGPFLGLGEPSRIETEVGFSAGLLRD